MRNISSRSAVAHALRVTLPATRWLHSHAFTFTRIPQQQFLYFPKPHDDYVYIEKRYMKNHFLVHDVRDVQKKIWLVCNLYLTETFYENDTTNSGTPEFFVFFWCMLLTRLWVKSYVVWIYVKKVSAIFFVALKQWFSKYTSDFAINTSYPTIL